LEKRLAENSLPVAHVAKQAKTLESFTEKLTRKLWWVISKLEKLAVTDGLQRAVAL
jgi:hypothetical protein